MLKNLNSNPSHIWVNAKQTVLLLLRRMFNFCVPNVANKLPDTLKLPKMLRKTVRDEKSFISILSLMNFHILSKTNKLIHTQQLSLPFCSLFCDTLIASCLVLMKKLICSWVLLSAFQQQLFHFVSHILETHIHTNTHTHTHGQQRNGQTKACLCSWECEAQWLSMYGGSVRLVLESRGGSGAGGDR